MYATSLLSALQSQGIVSPPIWKKAPTMFQNPVPTNKSNNSLHQRSGTLHNRFYLQVNDVVEKAAELAAVKIEVLYLPAEQIKQGWQQSKLPRVAPCRLGRTPSSNNSVSRLRLWYRAGRDSGFLWQQLLITEKWPWKSLSPKGQQTDVHKKETLQMFE